ncbi:MAG: hypothetical protein ACLR5S_04945 [Ruminococcus sp.]
MLHLRNGVSCIATVMAEIMELTVVRRHAPRVSKALIKWRCTTADRSTSNQKRTTSPFLPAEGLTLTHVKPTLPIKNNEKGSYHVQFA